MNQDFSHPASVVSATVFSSSIDAKPILAKRSNDDDDGDEVFEESEASKQGEGSDGEASGDGESSEGNEQGGDVANASTSRNVGKKYKRWDSKKERDKHYKKLNNGPTIATRKKIGEEKNYEPIPAEGLIVEGYAISQYARIRLQNGSITTGSTGDRAKIEIPGYGGFIIARLMASSFGLLTDNNHEVDHIDPSRPLNDSLVNLQGLSKKDHALKTQKDNPQIAQGVKISLSKPILGRKYLSNDEFVQYQSSRDAEKATGVSSANIRVICAKRAKNNNYVYQCGQHEWKYAERNMGELAPSDAIWKQIFTADGLETPHAICQYGLVRRGDRFITRGSLCCGRYEFGSFQVSILVAIYFLPLPTDPSRRTVNHKDLNPLNNNVSNLEWSSDREQVIHSYANNPNRKVSTLTKKCKYRTKDSQEWTVCESIAQASRATGVSVRSIRKNFLRESLTEKGFEFEEIEIPLLADEKFVPLRLYQKKERRAERAPEMLEMLRGPASAFSK